MPGRFSVKPASASRYNDILVLDGPLAGQRLPNAPSERFDIVIGSAGPSVDSLPFHTYELELRDGKWVAHHVTRKFGRKRLRLQGPAPTIDRATSAFQVAFDHGLGDSVQFAHLLQLYRRRGYDIRVDYADDKELVWRAAGISRASPEGAAYHQWGHAVDFNHPVPGIEWSGNKTASNINQDPLPPIGDLETLWEELCGVNLEGSVERFVTGSDLKKIQELTSALPRPIFLVHPQGTGWPERKNFPRGVAGELAQTLLNRCAGSVVILDWDMPESASNDERIRHGGSDWSDLSLGELTALMRESAVLIGVDSGPYHFASMTGLPAVGVFREHYPSCVALPRAKNVNLAARRQRPINLERRARWNIVEYAGVALTAEDIAAQALRVVEGPRYGLPIGPDTMLQQWIRDWSAESPEVDRSHGLDFIFREVAERFAAPVIVEIGSVQAPEDWSHGYSTYLFGAYLSFRNQGKLISLDRAEAARSVTANATRAWANYIEHLRTNAEKWLAGSAAPIDVLYFGGREADSFGERTRSLRETQAAEHRLTDSALVVYDATECKDQWNGKGTRAVQHLLERGWSVLFTRGQTVLSKVRSRSTRDASSP